MREHFCLKMGLTCELRKGPVLQSVRPAQEQSPGGHGDGVFCSSWSFLEPVAPPGATGEGRACQLRSVMGVYGLAVLGTSVLK